MTFAARVAGLAVGTRFTTGLTCFAGLTRPVAAWIGETLLVALKRAGMPLLAVCGGRAACGTCLISIAPEWLPRLPPACCQCWGSLRLSLNG